MVRLGEKPKGKSPLLNFRVTEETMQRLKDLASDRGVTVSEYARMCLEKCIAKESKRR